MITYNNKDILKFFIGNNRIVKKYLNNKVVYGTPDFVQYYNIQGYDNYEVVGSPTITDGVASGFSSSNYLTLNSLLPDLDDIEGQVKFTTASQTGQQGIIFQARRMFNIDVWGRQKISTYNWATNVEHTIVPTSDYAVGATYIVKFKSSPSQTENRVNVAFSYSKNGGDFSTPVTYELFKSQDTAITLGNSSVNTSYYFGGSIDLNQTYIKVNGQYWFNGNQNYKELLWCNPNVYLQSSGTQYIDTDISGVVSAELDAKGIRDNSVSQIVLGKYSSGPNFFGQVGTSKKWGVGNDQLSDLPYINRGKFLVNFNSNGISFTYNGITYDRSTGTVQIDRNIFIFACNAASKYYASVNVYSLKIYNSNNELIRNFVPVPQGLQIGSYKVPSNGMFDIVEQKFYENEGSREFIWGVDL